MQTLSIIKKRREITQFSPTPIPREHIRLLVEAGYYSVTGNNLPSREFIIVEDAEARAALSQATPFMRWAKDAPLNLVIVGNPQESKYWLQDATIATSNIWLVATELGLGAAWGAIHHAEEPEECARREQAVRAALGIPQELRPVSVLGIGYPAAPPKDKQMYPLELVVHLHTYGNRVDDLGRV